MHPADDARSSTTLLPPTHRYSSIGRAFNADYPYTAYKPSHASHPYTSRKPSHASHPYTTHNPPRVNHSYTAYRPPHSSCSYASYRPRPSDVNYPYTAYRPPVRGPSDGPPKEVPPPPSSRAGTLEPENSVMPIENSVGKQRPLLSIVIPHDHVLGLDSGVPTGMTNPHRATPGPKSMESSAALNRNPSSIAVSPDDLVIDQIDIPVGGINPQTPDDLNFLGNFMANEYQGFSQSPTTYSSTTSLVVEHGITGIFTPAQSPDTDTPAIRSSHTYTPDSRPPYEGPHNPNVIRSNQPPLAIDRKPLEMRGLNYQGADPVKSGKMTIPIVSLGNGPPSRPAPGIPNTYMPQLEIASRPDTGTSDSPKSRRSRFISRILRQSSKSSVYM